MHFPYLVSKTRKPKFELTFKIIDLNNIPLVSGTSFVKWHLPSSSSAEHRGRTDKSPIKDHKVCWDYEKAVPVRFSLDKANMLQECIINFEVIQEYNSGARGEKIALGHVSLNLAEYVDAQERDQDGDEGVMRRYLMQESKINSTLKIGISMRQLDGERNFIAPPLRTAPVFGGITGIMDFEQQDDDLGHMPAVARSRETAQLQDLYRRALAASWGAQPSELRADQCIEDIFSGGNGWSTSPSLPINSKFSSSLSLTQENNNTPNNRHRGSIPGTSTSGDEDEDGDGDGGRMPTMISRNYQPHHHRSGSANSTRSTNTVTGRTYGTGAGAEGEGHKYSKNREANEERGGHVRGSSRGSIEGHLQGTSSSENSSEMGIYAFKRAREVDEFAIRDNLMAWRLPGSAD